MVGFPFFSAWPLTLPLHSCCLYPSVCLDTSFVDYDTLASDLSPLHTVARLVFCKDSLHPVISHFRTLLGILSRRSWTPAYLPVLLAVMGVQCYLNFICKTWYKPSASLPVPVSLPWRPSLPAYLLNSHLHGLWTRATGCWIELHCFGLEKAPLHLSSLAARMRVSRHSQPGTESGPQGTLSSGSGSRQNTLGHWFRP